ncbi:hypothetical protein B566_EDAN015258 [Ephemera danica]|nr:hypothetical protein B566_EDAN015258 [Ephemera danica]
MLQRYLSGVAKSKEPIKIPLVENIDYGSSAMSDDIVQSMGNNPVLSRKTKFLLSLLSRSTYISLDESNKSLQGSNIIDLLNDVLRNREHGSPVEWEQFARVLASLNIPREFIHNEQRWAYIQSHNMKMHGTKRRLTSDDDDVEMKRKKIVRDQFRLPPFPDKSDDDDDYPDPSNDRWSMTDDETFPSITDDLSPLSLTDDESDYITADEQIVILQRKKSRNPWFPFLARPLITARKKAHSPFVSTRDH